MRKITQGAVTIALSSVLWCVPIGLERIPVAAAAACPAATVIAIPGTTETSPGANPRIPTGLLKEAIEPLKRVYKSKVSSLYVPYPAAIMGDNGAGIGYNASRQTGVNNATATILDQSKKCPNTRFIITGYSQGAHAAGDLAAQIGAGRNSITPEKIIGVALLADPAQAPEGEPTIGLSAPGMGFAGVRPGGFGALASRTLAICTPGDFYCNIPSTSPTLRLIGQLGSQLDGSNPQSANQMMSLFIGTFLAPVSEAITGFLGLLNQPNFVGNLIGTGRNLLAALVQQIGAASPLLQGIGTIITSVQAIVNAVNSRNFAQIPGLVATAVRACTDIANNVQSTQDAVKDFNYGNDWSAVGTATGRLQQAAFARQAAIPDGTEKLFNLVSAAMHGLMSALPTSQYPTMGTMYSQFTPNQVTSDLISFAKFLQGGAHTSYNDAPIDQNGHTGTQVMTRFMANQISQLPTV
ncbi:cutinase family protein [Mycobacteroides abscessus]|uniref:cutinase family protein n=1 Tax=Mycobacteroides abscessus TaxID=36809 RepID=UPI0009A74930|nr:cutinase family protein [Mycobacteroides abscessus]SKK36285.1 Cutinase [Mycobacteroides abscessus subsp. abscessus]